MVYKNKQKIDSKKKQKVFHQILLALSFLLFWMVFSKDSQVYFNSSFIIYSLIFTILVYLLVCYKSLKNKRGFNLFCLSMIILILTVSVWLLPKTLHHTFLLKENICFKANITSKFWHRYGEAGYVNFVIDKNTTLPKSLIEFHSLDKLSKYDYDSFPSKGNEVYLCGDISKVGYTYTHIEPLTPTPTAY